MPNTNDSGLSAGGPAPEALLREPTPWKLPHYTGDATFDERKGPEIRKTFFYYFGQGKNGCFRARVYILDGGFPTDKELQDCIAQARQCSGGQPYSDDVGWNAPCYLVVFVDMPNWQYLMHDKKNKSLHFAEDKALHIHGNHSFYNARSQPITVDGAPREMLVVENHHLKAPEPGYTAGRARQEGDPPDRYKFDIYLGQPMEGTSGKKMWLVLDPGGRNIGPP